MKKRSLLLLVAAIVQETWCGVYKINGPDG
jgi:hypothetical protein